MDRIAAAVTRIAQMPKETWIRTSGQAAARFLTYASIIGGLVYLYLKSSQILFAFSSLAATVAQIPAQFPTRHLRKKSAKAARDAQPSSAPALPTPAPNGLILSVSQVRTT